MRFFNVVFVDRWDGTCKTFHSCMAPARKPRVENAIQFSIGLLYTNQDAKHLFVSVSHDCGTGILAQCQVNS